MDIYGPRGRGQVYHCSTSEGGVRSFIVVQGLSVAGQVVKKGEGFSTGNLLCTGLILKKVNNPSPLSPVAEGLPDPVAGYS